jgi:uncharacterized ion transporter superfamily protein YfcC
MHRVPPRTKGVAMADSEQQRRAAIKRLKNKRDFGQHVVVYVVINAFLVFIWAVTGAGYFWPVWAIAGWGIGLVLHGWSVFYGRSITEADIEREMHRRGDTTA